MQQPDMRHETPTINMLREALPDKIQLNGKAYTAIQDDSELEPSGMEQQWTHPWDKSQEYIAGIFIEKHEWNKNELILR